ncbi:KTSC domain-containing protein [Daejeonella sp.]|uniref:KTSC domain-containing protein n=1 Tax=Daejeonella sp. TaxID=2805397 RepID=UPI0030BF9A34
MPSSVVDTINYFPETLILRVTFVSGLIYDYKDVPSQVFKALKVAGSKGRFFNFHIKGKYEYDRIS